MGAVHLIGQRDCVTGHKTKRIHSITGCKVNLSRYDKERKIPMIITIQTDPRYHESNDHRGNMEKAIAMVEESLYDFINDRDANSRLRHELRSGSLTNSLLQRETLQVPTIAGYSCWRSLEFQKST